jgi:Uma2 family endonuclease
MSTLLDPDTSAESLADLLSRLGDISPARIRMHPSPGSATEADVLRIHAREKRLFELIDGVLVEKGMGYRESVLAMAIVRALANWVLPRDLGAVSGPDGMMKVLPEQVRLPDVAFASWSRFPGGKIAKDPVPSLTPDIAVEVLSESNTPREMARKRLEYFESGVQLVWIVDPDARIVVVYTAPDAFVVLSEADTLDGGKVLPGFTLPLRELFATIAS